MSEYTEVEQAFLSQLAAQGWTVIDQGAGVPQDPRPSLRLSFREFLFPEVFNEAVRAINLSDDGQPWLSARQLDDLQPRCITTKTRPSTRACHRRPTH